VIELLAVHRLVEPGSERRLPIVKLEKFVASPYKRD